MSNGVLRISAVAKLGVGTFKFSLVSSASSPSMFMVVLLVDSSCSVDRPRPCNPSIRPLIPGGSTTETDMATIAAAVKNTRCRIDLDAGRS